ncbi:hypothetical protein [Faecalibacillus faecis]|mgnify:CR=1 FL=1|jgi:hypothetical protein|uniref:hypothetical protein n=1 Tax=Faecalibacillus faecis TaxID=1982628 RepID=UPI00386B5237
MKLFVVICFLIALVINILMVLSDKFKDFMIDSILYIPILVVLCLFGSIIGIPDIIGFPLVLICIFMFCILINIVFLIAYLIIKLIKIFWKKIK